ncbi:hypothetical protein YK56LOC_33960 [Caballeronia sp. HLA56]
MGILLAFSPFLAFVVIERTIGVPAGLAAGAIVSALLLLRDMVSPTRKVKVLEIGNFILFAGLTLIALLPGATEWSIAAVRLRVDTGLLLIVLASIAMRRPFTLQYAREEVSSDLWESPAFMRTNYVITAAWAAAFAIMVIADVALTYLPALPRSVSIVATVLALVGAVKFTGWYPERERNAVPGR